jgi:NEDD4-binding protein 2
VQAARRLLAEAGQGVLLSADDFFQTPLGYTFRPEALGEAHSAAQRRAAEAVQARTRLIVIDNTHTQVWEMRPYVSLAVGNGYKVHIVEPDTDWKFSPRQLASKTLHNVPLQKIKEMLDRYEKNIDLQKLLNQWDLPPAPTRSEETSKRLVDYSTHDSSQSSGDEEDIYQSDTEEGHALEAPAGQVIPGLDPSVAEFIPLGSRDGSPVTVPGEEAEGEAEEEGGVEGAEGRGVGGLLQALRAEAGLAGPPPPGAAPESEPDVSELLSMFPHLSLGQLETLYMVHQGSTTSVVTALLDEAEETLDLVPRPAPGPVASSSATSYSAASYSAASYSAASYSSAISSTASNCSEPEAPSVKMSLDPMFAVTLQERYGSPVDDSLLGLLTTEELLEVEIPESLALELFAAWRRSLHTRLGSKPLLGQPAPAPLPRARSAEPGPRTVLAPNAVEYYAGRGLSPAPAPTRAARPLVVVRDRSPALPAPEGDRGLQDFIRQRDELYRKARAGSKIQVRPCHCSPPPRRRAWQATTLRRHAS